MTPIRIRAATNKQSAEIDVIGEFDGWDVDDKNFAEVLHSLQPDASLSITLNSPGGSVDIATSIYNMLKTHKGPVNIRVTGWACSAATVITSLPNAHVTMGSGTLLMVHNPWLVSVGDHHELRRKAAITEKVADSIASIYVQKTGKTLDEIRELMDSETWYTAEEAVANGFADSVDESEQVAASVGNEQLFLAGVAFDFSGRKAPPLDKLWRNFRMSENTQKAELNKTATPLVPTPMTAEALKAQYPDLIKSLVDSAVEQALAKERTRMHGLDALITPARAQDIQRAKYETFATPEQAAFAILTKEQQIAKDSASALLSDGRDIAASVSELAAGAPDASAKESGSLNTQDIAQWMALAERIKAEEKRV